MANFRHNIKDKQSAGQITNVWKSKPFFDFECDQTMIGFVQKVNGGDSGNSTQIQCFYGVMNEDSKSVEPSKGKLINKA